MNLQITNDTQYVHFSNNDMLSDDDDKHQSHQPTHHQIFSLNCNKIHHPPSTNPQNPQKRQCNKKCCHRKCSYFCNKTQKPLCLRCPKQLRPQFCNCICLTYTFICICILLIIAIIIILYAILPSINPPLLVNVFIQLFSYAIHYDISLSPLYFETNAELKVEIKNSNFISVALHDWNFTVISYNSHHLKEQWGSALCCGQQNHWNIEQQYNASIVYPYDREIEVSSYSSGNVSLMLFAPFVSDDMIDVFFGVYEGVIHIGLHGYGYIRIPHTIFDFHTFLDCMLVLKSSFIDGFKYDVDVNQTSMHNLSYVDVPFVTPSPSVLNKWRTPRPTYRFMPKTYVWGTFPVVNQSCNIGVLGLRIR